MNGDEVIEDSVIVISDGRITEVGSRANVKIPEGYDRWDMSGKVIAPGYIDTHAHYDVRQEVPSFSNWSFLANLAYGVTTGIDVQPSTIDLISAQDMVDAGLMLGPRAYSTGPGIFSDHQFSSKQQAYGVLKRYKEHYGVRNLKAYLTGDRKQRQWLLQAAKELQLMPTTEGGLDMKMDLTHMIDGFSGNEHNFPLDALYDDVVQLTAQTRIAYTPTLLVLYGGPAGEHYFYNNESPHDDAKRCGAGHENCGCRRTGRHWCSRSVAGTGLSLGAVVGGEWRFELQCFAFRHTNGRSDDWPGSGSRIPDCGKTCRSCRAEQ
jgi:hypothetical protein